MAKNEERSQTKISTMSDAVGKTTKNQPVDADTQKKVLQVTQWGQPMSCSCAGEDMQSPAWALGLTVPACGAGKKKSNQKASNNMRSGMTNQKTWSYQESMSTALSNMKTTFPEHTCMCAPLCGGYILMLKLRTTSLSWEAYCQHTQCPCSRHSQVPETSAVTNWISLRSQF